MKDLIKKYPRLSIIITIVLAIIVLAITAQAGGPCQAGKCLCCGCGDIGYEYSKGNIAYEQTYGKDSR